MPPQDTSNSSNSSGSSIAGVVDSPANDDDGDDSGTVDELIREATKNGPNNHHRLEEQQQEEEEDAIDMTSPPSRMESSQQVMDMDGDDDDDDDDEHNNMEESQETHNTQLGEMTQLTQTYADTQLTPLDETSNLMSASVSSQTQSPHSASTGANSPPPPPMPWGRIVPCNLTAATAPTGGNGTGRRRRGSGSSNSSHGKSRNTNSRQSDPTVDTAVAAAATVARPPTIAPMEFVSDQDEYTIGRSNKCDVTASANTVETNPTLSEKDQKIYAWGHSLISNRHCKIFIDRTAVNGGDGGVGGLFQTNRQRQQLQLQQHGGFFNNSGINGYGRFGGGVGCSGSNNITSNNDFPVYIEDTSGNGTIINQQTQLRKGEKRQLHSGDEILLIDPNILRKRVKSERMIQEVLSAYSFTFIQPKQPRKPCVDPRAMNYHQRQNYHNNNSSNTNNYNQGYRHFGGLAAAAAAAGGGGGLVGRNSNGIGGMNHQPQPFRAGVNRSKRALSFSGASAFSPTPEEGRIELVYDIREVLGDGTSGQVRRCIHRKTGKEFAVKVIGLRRQFDVTAMEREVSLLQSLDHPYITQLVDVFVKPGHAMYIVMELVKGGDLFEKISEIGKYTETEARQTMRRLLSAVHYLHEDCNIVHRDLKPENILCSSSVNIKLADFGLAKTVKADGLKTFCGTPAYFAPEVLQRRGTVAGEGRYGRPADMWSIGVILYILLVGRPPFDADMDDPKTFEFETDEFDPICEYPLALDFVQQLLRQDPKRRPDIRQACSHPWINIDDGDTHCHPLDDPAVTTKKRLFDDEKPADHQIEAAEEPKDQIELPSRNDDSDDASIRSKDSIMSKEEFSQAANSHIRTDSFFHVDSTTSSSNNKKTGDGKHRKDDDETPQEESSRTAVSDPTDTSSKNAKDTNDTMDTVDSNQSNGKDRPHSPSPRDVAKQMSIDSSRSNTVESETDDDRKVKDTMTESSIINEPDEKVEPPASRSPLSKLNLNGRGNRFRDQVLNYQSNHSRNPSTSEASPVASNSRQLAVTPTSSNVRKQEREGNEGAAKSNDDNRGDSPPDQDPQFANEADDPILSQFSSETSSIGSFDDSVNTDRDLTSTTFDVNQVSADKKSKSKKKRRISDDARKKSNSRSPAEEADADDIPRPSKRARKDETTTGQTKKKKSTQTTLMAFFKNKK